MIPWVYGEIVRALSRHERVNLIVRGPSEWRRSARASATAKSTWRGSTFWELPTDRSWVRDSGPIFVVNERGERAVLDWHFNAWAKYPDWTHDDALPAFVAEQHRLAALATDVHDGHRVVLEGGSIDVNGAGPAAHDRGMLAEQDAGAQPAARPRRLRSGCSPTTSA